MTVGIQPPRPDGRPRIPRAVWALGFVSMFMDISSEIVHSLLPLFLTTTLGVSVAMVGLIDGIAEATASISKVFSGYISDHIGRRRLYLAGCHTRKPHRLDHLPDWRARANRRAARRA